MATEAAIAESTVIKNNEETENASNGNKENAENMEHNNVTKSTDKNSVENEDDLFKKIVRQIEYYFGNYNLPRDKFLSEQIKVDDGWISMEVMLKFKRLSSLSTDSSVIFKALQSSELLEANEAENKIRRSPDFPLPTFEGDLRADTIKRTIYCKGFPRDGTITLDFLLDFFKPFGPFETIHMRHFFDKVTKKSGFKGSVLVVFPDVEKAKEFMKIDDVSHKKMPILRKWHADYLEEKKAEFEERKARKEARKIQLEQESAKAKNAMEPLPKGTFLHVSGFSNTTMREDFKAAVLDLIDDIAFIDFSKGDTEGYIRLSVPNSNQAAAEALNGKLKVNDCDITVRIVEGEEEEEQIKKVQLAKSRAHSGHKRPRQGGRGGGRHFKRRRT